MNTPEITPAKIIPLELDSIGESAAKPDDVDKELLPFFEEEAHVQLREIEKLLQEWDREISRNPLKELTRHFHTLKGAANSIGHLRIGVLAAGMEDLVKRINPEDGFSLRPQVIKTSVIVRQVIEALMKEARQPQYNTVRKEQVIRAAESILQLKQRELELKAKT